MTHSPLVLLNENADANALVVLVAFVVVSLSVILFGSINVS